MMSDQEPELSELQILRVDVEQLRDRVFALELLNRFLLVELLKTPHFQGSQIYRALCSSANQFEDEGLPFVAQELDVLREMLADVLSCRQNAPER